MNEGLRTLAKQIDQLRDKLHTGYAQVGFTHELLLLSQKLDQLIVEYTRLQKASRSY